jgi:hypothetical protein
VEIKNVERQIDILWRLKCKILYFMGFGMLNGEYE